jgi:hypothetical protein
VYISHIAITGPIALLEHAVSVTAISTITTIAADVATQPSEIFEILILALWIGNFQFCMRLYPDFNACGEQESDYWLTA